MGADTLVALVAKSGSYSWFFRTKLLKQMVKTVFYKQLDVAEAGLAKKKTKSNQI